MWSKRRRKIRKRYDWREHQWKLIKARIMDELCRRISEKLERAILYGAERT